MRNVLQWIATAVVCLTMCPAVARGQAARPAPEPKIGQAVSYQNLTVWPLYAAAGERPESYLALDEAMEKGLVKVREKGPKGSGSVNEVIVENRSSKPLFLLGGEVILGGKQDRILGRDTIVAPRTTSDVAVFCVEHGRWAGGGNGQFSSGKALAHSKLRGKAKFEGQGQVWKEVADKNAALKTENSTDTYRQVATSKEIDAKVEAYASHVIGGLDQLGDADQVVGFAIAVNGDVKAVERFASPALFKKYRGKLLRSYFIEAVDQPVIAAAPKPTADDVSGFVKKGRAGKKADVINQATSKTSHYEGDEVKGSAVTDSRSPDAPAVYESFQKE